MRGFCNGCGAVLPNHRATCAIGQREHVKDKFKNSDGSLTAYAFACGYIQEKQDGPLKAELYHDGCYHVRAFRDGKRVYWESFDKLGDARRHYARIRGLAIASEEKK